MFKAMLLINLFFFCLSIYCLSLPFIVDWLAGQAKLITALLFLEDKVTPRLLVGL